MAQAFVTTTMDSYRWHSLEAREGPFESLYTKYFKKPSPSEKGEWIEEDIIDSSNKPSELNYNDLKKEIHKLRKHMYISTYTDTICHGKEMFLKNHRFNKEDEEEETMSKKASKVPSELKNNDMVLLTQAEFLYNPVHKPKLPTLNTFREMFGYNRPSRFGPKLSTYQDEIGRVAYQTLRGDFREPKVQNEEKNKENQKNKPLKIKHKTDLERMALERAEKKKYHRRSKKPICVDIEWAKEFNKISSVCV